ncbi:hypothetical protein HZA57_06735 [Candidatus Poribacteria bacterium]|nr:hypothetical protein [Candidatus Poribacteria bacterium]
MTDRKGTLAERLGMTVHESLLRRKLRSLRDEFPSATSECLEDWLVDVANGRGAGVVARPVPAPEGFVGPSTTRLGNEELVTGICQLQCLDRPQMLRLAAQLISRRAVDPGRLRLVARRERSGAVLASLAASALRVEPRHPTWRALHEGLADEPPLKDVVLHWTRLAEPVMRSRSPNARSWKLAA